MTTQENDRPTEAQPGSAQGRTGAASSAADDGSDLTQPSEAGEARADRADDDGQASGRGPARQPERHGADARYPRSSRPYRGLDLSLHDFRAELSAIADDVGYLLRNESVVNPELKAQLEQRVDRLRGTVSLMAEDARQAGDRLRAEVQDRVEERIRVSRGAVQERPITSVAMAAIVGLSVGMLLARRR